MIKTRHFNMSEPHTYPEDGTYVRFCFFTFTEDKLSTGQCQSVKLEDVPLEIAALMKGGWTPASYKYVNGRPVLVRKDALQVEAA